MVTYSIGTGISKENMYKYMYITADPQAALWSQNLANQTQSFSFYWKAFTTVNQRDS